LWEPERSPSSSVRLDRSRPAVGTPVRRARLMQPVGLQPRLQTGDVGSIARHQAGRPSRRMPRSHGLSGTGAHRSHQAPAGPADPGIALSSRKRKKSPGIVVTRGRRAVLRGGFRRSGAQAGISRHERDLERRRRMTAAQIAGALAMASSTVSAVLKRVGLGKRSQLARSFSFAVAFMARSLPGPAVEPAGPRRPADESGARRALRRRCSSPFLAARPHRRAGRCGSRCAGRARAQDHETIAARASEPRSPARSWSPSSRPETAPTS
jgi:hypothetical protein